MNSTVKIIITIILLSLNLNAGQYKSYSIHLDANFYVKKNGNTTALKSFKTQYGIYLSKKSLEREKPYCFESQNMTDLSEYISKPTYKMCIDKKNKAILYEINKKDFRYDRLNSYRVEIQNIQVDILNVNQNQSCHKEAVNYAQLNKRINECILAQ
ncbi:MAG: hypothetical protein ACNI3C_12570 [Candidatus Marinarcus sp.]|uniref:hypothetical protein n=1 Tax=Candidatus Marinarcus sp. TaxID=3100987 RepID=UPI003B000333